MLIPMEFLSPLMTGTDSGARVKAAPRAGPSKQDTNFANTFERELTRHDKKLLERNKGPDVSADRHSMAKNADEAEPDTVMKQDEQEDNAGQALAAGAQSLAEQALGQAKQEFTTILEGEESVSPAQRELPPQTQVQDTTQPQQPAQQPQINGQLPDEVKEDFNQLIKDAIDVTAQKPDNTSQQAAQQEASESGIAQLKETITAKTETVNNTAKETETGEVTARMPEVNSEAGKQKTNQQSEQNLKDNGNPSPLENESEYQGKTEQKETTEFKQAAQTKTTDTETQQKPIETAQSEPYAPPLPISDMIKPEQIKGMGQLTQAAVHQPVKPENLFDEIVSRVQTSQDASKSTMTIQLNPEFLGKVALELSIDSAGLHVKINAEDNGVRNMINSQLNTLIESLTNKGIAVSEVDVVFAGANFESHSEPNSGRQESSHRGHNAAGKASNKDTVEYYTTVSNLMDFYFDAGISSVQYTA